MIANLLNRAVRAVCEFAATRLPRRTIIGADNSPYLTRYLVIEGENWRLYLHRFHRSDEDPELHNHPWLKSVSLILAGGYSEERRRGDRMVWRQEFRPWMVNVLQADTFHRVDLLDPKEGAWTLFWVGEKVQSWGFWSRETGEFTPWRQFIAKKNEARDELRSACADLKDQLRAVRDQLAKAVE